MYDSYSIKRGKTARYGTGPLRDNEAASLITRAVKRRIPTSVIIKVRSRLYMRTVRYFNGQLIRIALSDCPAALRRYDSGSDRFSAAKGIIQVIGALGGKEIPNHVLAHMVRVMYCIAEDYLGVAIDPGKRFEL